MFIKLNGKMENLKVAVINLKLRMYMLKIWKLRLYVF